MRFVLHVSVAVDKFDEAVRDGTVSDKMHRILKETKPEDAYFCAKDGKRGGFIVVDMADPSEMPRYAEPWFPNFDATVEFLPAMTAQDLQRAGLDQIAKKWR